MATSEQIKSLIRSHFSEQPDRFFSIALQLAAHEAKQGHSALAHDIRDLVDAERKKRGPNILEFPKNLTGLILTEEPRIRKSSLVIEKHLMTRLELVIQEYYQRDKLKSHGLNNRRKILLTGPPGTGKTMTARVLAHELHMPLHTVQVDRLVTKFMGETSAKLRQIFDLMQKEKAVYFFDEFDAIGGERSLDNDVGEMRRVINAFLQFIEQDTSESIIVAATNHPRLLGHALFRRFDDVFHYILPNEKDRKDLIANVLGLFKEKNFTWGSILTASKGLSHSEIDIACRDAIKATILNDKEKVSADSLQKALQHRLDAIESFKP